MVNICFLITLSGYPPPLSNKNKLFEFPFLPIHKLTIEKHLKELINIFSSLSDIVWTIIVVWYDKLYGRPVVVVSFSNMASDFIWGKRRMKIGGLLCFCFFLYDAYIPQQSLSMSSHWSVTFFDKSEVGEQKAHCDFRWNDSAVNV